ncbi:MAG: SMC-Scp complex subunit ScpB [Patescibacteria group bacterium]
MKTSEYIEAILFMRGEPVTISELMSMLSIDSDQAEEAVAELEEQLSTRGIRLMRTNDYLTLATAPEASDKISALAKEELNSGIGNAGMEVLTIVLYASPISRRQIDYIRGVNSSSVLKKLTMKGMVERKKSESNQAFIYVPTPDMMSFLGLTKLEDMIYYQSLREKFLGILGADSSE